MFFFFAAWMVIMTLYVAFFVPETKDLGVENVMVAWNTYVLLLSASLPLICMHNGLEASHLSCCCAFAKANYLLEIGFGGNKYQSWDKEI